MRLLPVDYWWRLAEQGCVFERHNPLKIWSPVWQLFRPGPWFNIKISSSQHTKGVTVTSLLRRNGVAASFWRDNDVNITPCVCSVTSTSIWARYEDNTDNTTARSSYLHNGISYTSEMTCLNSAPWCVHKRNIITPFLLTHSQEHNLSYSLMIYLMYVKTSWTDWVRLGQYQRLKISEASVPKVP